MFLLTLASAGASGFCGGSVECPPVLKDATVVIRGTATSRSSRSPMPPDGQEPIGQDGKNAYFQAHHLPIDTLFDGFVWFEVEEVLSNRSGMPIPAEVQVRFEELPLMDGDYPDFGPPGTEVVAFLYQYPSPAGWEAPLFAPTVGLHNGVLLRYEAVGDGRCDAVADAAGGRAYAPGKNFLISLDLSEDERMEVNLLSDGLLSRGHEGMVVTASEIATRSRDEDGDFRKVVPGLPCDYMHWDELLGLLRATDAGVDR